jgi:hypothetical protein
MEPEDVKTAADYAIYLYTAMWERDNQIAGAPLRHPSRNTHYDVCRGLRMAYSAYVESPIMGPKMPMLTLTVKYKNQGEVTLNYDSYSQAVQEYVAHSMSAFLERMTMRQYVETGMDTNNGGSGLSEVTLKEWTAPAPIRF